MLILKKLACLMGIVLYGMAIILFVLVPSLALLGVDDGMYDDPMLVLFFGLVAIIFGFGTFKKVYFFAMNTSLPRVPCISVKSKSGENVDLLIGDKVNVDNVEFTISAISDRKTLEIKKV